jgi:hypothetical protein
MLVRTSISMPEELNTSLIKLAQAENRTISSMIQVCIKESIQSRGIGSIPKEDAPSSEDSGKKVVKPVIKKKIRLTGKSL